MELWLLQRRPAGKLSQSIRWQYGPGPPGIRLGDVMLVMGIIGIIGIISVVQLERRAPTRECACAVNRRTDISPVHMSKYYTGFAEDRVHQVTRRA